MPKRNLIWVLAVLAAAAVILWVMRKLPTVWNPGARPSTELDPVAEAYQQIKDRYYQPVDGLKLRQSAVSGMVKAIKELCGDPNDEYSTYIPPDKMGALRDRVMEGKDRGVGLRLEVVGGQVRVIGTLPDSPACKAGVAAGDRILAIDDADVDTEPLEGIQRMLEGEIGKPVKLTIVQGGGRRATLSVTRGEFDIQTVQGLCRDGTGRWVYWADPNRQAGYIRVREFVSRTVQEIGSAIRAMDGPKGLILDLRDNPGGMEQAAFETADLFLREGVIMTKIDRTGRRSYPAHAEGTYPDDLLVVILVNGKTASAAEIVAGAMRLHDRAVLVGTRTLGKGCIQSMIPLKDDLGQIYLTTAKFLVGEDEPISRDPNRATWGVDPHVEAPLAPQVQEEVRSLQERLELVSRPLPGTLPATVSEGRTQDAQLRRLLALDAQLARAVELLQRPARMRDILLEAARKREAERAERARTSPARTVRP